VTSPCASKIPNALLWPTAFTKLTRPKLLHCDCDERGVKQWASIGNNTFKHVCSRFSQHILLYLRWAVSFYRKLTSASLFSGRTSG